MSPRQIIDKMMSLDAFSQWLGIQIIDCGLGYAIIDMTITDQMVNGFNIAHGGISFSLADSAFAFASNSYGEQCVSIETSINHHRPVFVGDKLTAKTLEINKSKTLRVYSVSVHNQNKILVASFKGTVYNTGKVWS